VSGARYDGLADEYAAFQERGDWYYAIAEQVLCRLLGPGTGRCLDVGCGTGRYLAAVAALGFTVVGIDESEDQLRLAAAAAPGAELVLGDSASLPFPDASFEACVSTFTHTDVDDFAALVREAWRVLRPGGRLVYVGNHPCFVGPVQEHVEEGQPTLHRGYRRSGRWDSATAPGVTPGGWRIALGSSVHLTLADFLRAFAGFELLAVEEPDDGWDYPKTIALSVAKPRAA
jgi:SAM-dependent methyltransferase